MESLIAELPYTLGALKHLVVETLSAVGHLCCAAVGGDSAVHMVNVCAILVTLYTEVAGLWHPWALTLIPSVMKSCGSCIRELSYRLKCQQLGFGLKNTMWWRPAGTASAICELDPHLIHSYQPMKFTISTTTKPVPVCCTLHHQTNMSAGKWGGGGVSHQCTALQIL